MRSAVEQPVDEPDDRDDHQQRENASWTAKRRSASTPAAEAHHTPPFSASRERPGKSWHTNCARLVRMPHEIDRAGIEHLLHARGAAIVEVLPRDEFDREHLRSAINLPLRHLNRESAQAHLGPDRQRPIVVYCQSVE